MKILDISLLEAPVDVIGHCCNCQNTMGSGIARFLRDKWPVVYDADTEATKASKVNLGAFSIAKINDPKSQIKRVFNLYGQDLYGRDARMVNYEAIYQALSSMASLVKSKGVPLGFTKVGFPHGMGCVRAGGDWRIVEKMIEVAFENTGLEVMICRYDKG